MVPTNQAPKSDMELQFKSAGVNFGGRHGRISHYTYEEALSMKFTVYWAEVDRRLLRRQKDQLEVELEHVRTHRRLHRFRRKNVGAPVVALVGYTNAGKSTLLNRLAHVKSVAEDKLFATLDPMTKKVRFEGGQEISLTDTVGFVQRLPTTLVAAFRATLEEVAEADLIIHVVDTSSSTMQRQIAAAEEVLEEIGAGDRPIMLALNKVEVLPTDIALQFSDVTAVLPMVRVSALKGEGIDELLHCISENLLLQFVALDVLTPYNHGELVALFHQYLCVPKKPKFEKAVENDRDQSYLTQGSWYENYKR
jgi:GTPase